MRSRRRGSSTGFRPALDSLEKRSLLSGGIEAPGFPPLPSAPMAEIAVSGPTSLAQSAANGDRIPDGFAHDPAHPPWMMEPHRPPLFGGGYSPMRDPQESMRPYAAPSPTTSGAFFAFVITPGPRDGSLRPTGMVQPDLPMPARDPGPAGSALAGLSGLPGNPRPIRPNGPTPGAGDAAFPMVAAPGRVLSLAAVMGTDQAMGAGLALLAMDQLPALGMLPGSTPLDLARGADWPANLSSARSPGPVAPGVIVTPGPAAADRSYDAWRAGEEAGTGIFVKLGAGEATRVGRYLRQAILRLGFAAPGVPLELPMPDDAGLIEELSPFDRGALERAIDQFIGHLDGATTDPLADHHVDQAVRLSVMVAGALIALELLRRRWRPGAGEAALVEGRGRPQGESLAGFPELPGIWSSRTA